MAYFNSGYTRSMKVQITKIGSDNSEVTDTYDGQLEFGAFPAIPDNDTFRRLERNGTNGDWDLRLAAFKTYVQSEAGIDAYSSIDWSDAVVAPNTYHIAIQPISGTSGNSVIAVLYSNNQAALALENIVVALTTNTNPAELFNLTISIGNQTSSIHQFVEPTTTINNASVISVTPSSSANGIYGAAIEAENEWMA